MNSGIRFFECLIFLPRMNAIEIEFLKAKKKNVHKHFTHFRIIIRQIQPSPGVAVTTSSKSYILLYCLMKNGL